MGLKISQSFPLRSGVVSLKRDFLPSKKRLFGVKKSHRVSLGQQNEVASLRYAPHNVLCICAGAVQLLGISLQQAVRSKPANVFAFCFGGYSPF